MTAVQVSKLALIVPSLGFSSATFPAQHIKTVQLGKIIRLEPRIPLVYINVIDVFISV